MGKRLKDSLTEQAWQATCNGISQGAAAKTYQRSDPFSVVPSLLLGRPQWPLSIVPGVLLDKGGPGGLSNANFTEGDDAKSIVMIEFRTFALGLLSNILSKFRCLFFSLTLSQERRERETLHKLFFYFYLTLTVAGILSWQSTLFTNI